MGKRLAYIFIPVLLAAALLQIVFGNPDLRAFAFPVDVAILLALAGGLYVLNRERGDSRTVAALASGTAGVTLMALTAVGSLPIAFCPEAAWQQSWVFGAVLLLLMTNLLLAVFRYRGRFRWRFHLNHIGLLVLTAALAFGAADMERLRAAVNIGERIDCTYDEAGMPRALGYTLRVEKFEASFYANNAPADFRAVVSADGRSRTFRVNHPWHKSWKEDIYLTGYDATAGSASEYCILEFVVQPWKYVALGGLLAFLAGALLMIWGGKKNGKHELG